QRRVHLRRELVEHIERRLEVVVGGVALVLRRRGIVVAHDAAVREARRLRDTHAMSSLRVSRLREKLRPHVSLFGSNDSDLNGISYSAVQPPSKRCVAASQMLSQSV